MQKIFVILLVSLLAACGSESDNTQSDRMVKSILVGGAASEMQISYPGRVDADQRVDLAFQVSGTLKNFPVKEGYKVKAGDLLAQLDNQDYQNRYEAAKAQLDTTELNYERGKKLVTSGTIAQATFDELRAKYEAAKSNANISEKALKDTSLYAPFGGLIAKTYVDNFQEVQAKQKILSLQDIDEINIIIDVPEQDLINRSEIRQGNQEPQVLKNAYIKFDGVPGRRFEVKIKEYATEADVTTQTYRITLTMKAPEGVNILPGMTADLVVTPEEKKGKQVFFLPVTAVATDPDGNFYVWIIDEKTMTVSKKIVKTGEMHGNNITITSGLATGERVVTAGVPYLEEGMKVRMFTNEY